MNTTKEQQECLRIIIRAQSQRIREQDNVIFEQAKELATFKIGLCSITENAQEQDLHPLLIECAEINQILDSMQQQLLNLPFEQTMNQFKGTYKPRHLLSHDENEEVLIPNKNTFKNASNTEIETLAKNNVVSLCEYRKQIRKNK